ncbi:MAG: hypothetical protein QXJ17_01915 [Nitrososphaeria archaeon]
MSEKKETYKIVVINPLILVLIPHLLIHYVNKQNLAFSFNRDNMIGLLGAIFTGLWLILSALSFEYFGAISFVLFFFLIGSIGITILINRFIIGLIFIRKECQRCKFKKLIIDHEVIHLNSNATEKEVWKKLKTVYTAENIKAYNDGDICGFCPIPSRLVEE